MKRIPIQFLEIEPTEWSVAVRVNAREKGEKSKWRKRVKSILHSACLLIAGAKMS